MHIVILFPFSTCINQALNLELMNFPFANIQAICMDVESKPKQRAKLGGTRASLFVYGNFQL